MVNQRKGFIVIWISGIISIASILLLTSIEAFIGATHYEELKNSLITHNELKQISKLALIDNYAYEYINFTDLEKDRFQKRLEWAFPEHIKILEIKRSDYSIDPFSKRNHLISSHNFIHPLGNTRGTSIQQKTHIKYHNKLNNKIKELQLTAHLKEIPSNEISFISPSVFSPKNSSIPLIIEGTTLLNGFKNDHENNFTCDKLITKFYEEDFQKKSYNYLYSGYEYAFGYGIDPFKLLLLDNYSNVYKKQSYLEQKDSLTILFDGETLSHQIPGISIRSFNENVKRVIIDLNTIDKAKGIIYIHASNENAANQGIVIKGNTNNQPNQPYAILTNSTIWLWGNHTGTPIILGSSIGRWTLVDSSWKEGVNSVQPLNLTWNGYLFSPFNLTTFSSPQSGRQDGVFKIVGSLLIGGSISGNLKELHVKKPSYLNPTSTMCEKFLILENIE